MNRKGINKTLPFQDGIMLALYNTDHKHSNRMTAWEKHTANAVPDAFRK